MQRGCETKLAAGRALTWAAQKRVARLQQARALDFEWVRPGGRAGPKDSVWVLVLAKQLGRVAAIRSAQRCVSHAVMMLLQLRKRQEAENDTIVSKARIVYKVRTGADDSR